MYLLLAIKGKRYAPIALLCLYCTLFSIPKTNGQVSTSDTLHVPTAKSSAIPAKLDQLIAAYVATGLFNGTVLVSLHGKTLLHKGYGYSNLALKTPCNAETKFPLYSITKSMTASLVLKLIEQQKLTLNDRLSRFYPDMPTGDAIMIEHLLTHTSGLYAYNNDFSMPTHSEEAMIRFLSQRPLEFTPGSQWRYCNTGYYLLGFIVEKLTGLTYADALKTLIFDPLEMRQSGVDFKSLNSQVKATGYRFLYPDSGREANLYAHEELRSSGGIWSTAGDVLKFHNGMQQYQLISDTSTNSAYIPYKNQYGYGWFIDSALGTVAVSHSGGAAGFRTLLVRIPATNTCIILLANGENFDLAPMKEQILKLIAGLPYKIPYNETIGTEQLVQIEGTYKLEPGRYLYVNRIQRRLTAQVSRQQAVLLLASGGHSFAVDGMDGHLEFPPGKHGASDSVKLFRKSKVLIGLKVNASWGLTGSATPNGWNGPDIELYPVSQKPGIWVCENVTLKAGLIKFRFNNDWTFSLGATDKNTQYLTEGGNDIPVSAGTFTVILDLSDGARPLFSLKPANKQTSK